MDNVNISAIEQYVIDRVREKRKELGISQRDLADMLEMSNGFISMVESPKKRAKYNLAHLGLLADIFKCSPRDLLPQEWPIKKQKGAN